LAHKLQSDVALGHLSQRQKDKLRDFYTDQVERQLKMLKEQYEEEANGQNTAGSTSSPPLLDESLLTATDGTERLSIGSSNSQNALYFTATSPHKMPELLSQWEEEKLSQIEQQKQDKLQRILTEEAKRREFVESHTKRLNENDRNRLKRQREKKQRVQAFREIKLSENRQRRSEAQDEFVKQQQDVELGLIDRLKRNEKRRNLLNREKELSLQLSQEKNEEKLQQIREQHAQVQDELQKKAERERQRVEQAAKKHEQQMKALQESLKAQNEQKAEDIQRQVEEAQERKQKYKKEVINFALNRMEKAQENHKHLKKQMHEQIAERKREYELREAQRMETLKRHEEEEKQRLNKLIRRQERQHEAYLKRKADREQRNREKQLELALQAERRKNDAEKRRRCEQFQLEQRMRETDNKIQKLGMQNRKRLQIALLNKKISAQSSTEMERIRDYVASLKDESSVVPPEWVDVAVLRQFIQQQGLHIHIHKKAPLAEMPQIDDSTYDRLMGNFMRRETRQVELAFGRPFSPPVKNDGTLEGQILRSSWNPPTQESPHASNVASNTARSSYSTKKSSRRPANDVHDLSIPQVAPRKKMRRKETLRNSTTMSGVQPSSRNQSPTKGMARSINTSPKRESNGAGQAYDILYSTNKSTTKEPKKLSPYAQDLSRLVASKKRIRSRKSSPAKTNTTDENGSVPQHGSTQVQTTHQSMPQIGASAELITTDGALDSENETVVQ